MKPANLVLIVCIFSLCFCIKSTTAFTNKIEEPVLSIPLQRDGLKMVNLAAPGEAGLSTASSHGASPRPQVGTSVKNDLSLPLAWIPTDRTPPSKIILEITNRPVPPKKQKKDSLDPAVQSSPFSEDISVTPSIPATGANFEGVAMQGYLPPDTNGDIGPNHYVQTVNIRFAVFNRTGGLLLGPSNINTLWSGFGAPCETTNNGDPITLYDQLADRWLISQFSFPAGSGNGPYYQCVAISQTGDPTGSYYRYAFLWSDTVQDLMNDYPHFGVWPDGYYVAVNEFRNGASFAGAGAGAFERSRMLQGQPAQTVIFHQIVNPVNNQFDGGMLPSDLDGTTLPPANSPNFFADWEFYAVHLWKFQVNWTNPGSSTFTSQPYLNVSSFSQASSVPQPGTTRKLDALSDRLMFRLAYRNFGAHEALVANHSVSADGVAGIRWYEVRNPGSSPFVYQHGTYAPGDGVHRWMGSVAMDGAGNIGAGYTVSNSTSVYPGIRYTGRLVSDPLNQLPQGEGTIISGSGSQTGYSRWGDYSSINIDPTDDCTFWHTNEYYSTTATANWKTRIAAFKFSNCGGGGGCSAPSSLANNTAADLSACDDTGVQITWQKDAGNWGDGGAGTRTYDVLRNGVVIASGLAYGTTSYTDNGGTNGQSYTYTVRYVNGCLSSATTAGASAADNTSAPPVTETAAQLTSPITAQDSTVTSALGPAFTVAGAQATSANVNWTLSGNTNLTTCVAIRLRAPNSTETTLKAAGVQDNGSANVLSFYQSNGPGAYTIVLQELANCGGKGKRKASLTGTQMVVQKTGSCP